MRGRRSLALRRRTLSQAASGVCMDSVQLERSAPMFGACAGAVFRRGVRRGAVSRDFSPADILVELAALDHYPSTVFVDMDSEGYVCATGAGGGALVAARARLAPHVHAANMVVTRAGAGAVRLRVERAPAPLDELLLWFDEDLAAALHLPFLTLKNIKGRKEYECHECGARFEEPNPLKTHLLVRCAPLEPRRLWRLVTTALSPVPAPLSAFRRVSPTLAVAAGTVLLPEMEEAAHMAWAARLEAAAAEWGRARGGHTCLYCGKLYSRKYGLKIHLRTHTGYRPLRCRHCARAFGDPSNLNKHVRLHAAAAGASAGSHACARCGKTLARRRDLERHMRTHCSHSTAPTPTPATTAEH